MKTTDITRALRNASRPAARLAKWQAPGYGGRPSLSARLAGLREYLAKPYHAGENLATARKAQIDATGPELSSPDAEKPLLWLSGTKDPALQDWTAGRDFLNHRGWYVDQYQDETLETYAVTLKSFPRRVFYAVKGSCNGDLRVELSDWEEIDFSECGSDYQAADARREAAKEIIRSNDSSTQREAENSQEYYRKDQVERDIEENKETLATLRGEIRALAHELKTLCPSALAMDYPAAGKAVIASLRSLLSERRELMAENVKLAASL